jgi:hypothetical protein
MRASTAPQNGALLVCSAMHACHCTNLVQRIPHTNSYYAHVVTNNSSYSMCVCLSSRQLCKACRVLTTAPTHPAESM